MIKCVVIDDEPLARECLVNYIEEVDFLELVGQGSNPMELAKLIEVDKVDLVFLDIQMPIMNGIDFLKMANNLPMAILVTAYPEYALEGYQLDVIDYLLKPVTFNRFFKAATKAKEYYRLKYQQEGEVANAQDDYFFVKCDNKFEKITFSDVLYVQAMQNYVIICTQGQKYITLLNLKNVGQNLDPKSFVKVHKSFIVAVDKVESIEGNELLVHGMRIPISRNYRKEVLDQILGDKLWKSEGR